MLRKLKLQLPGEPLSISDARARYRATARRLRNIALGFIEGRRLFWIIGTFSKFFLLHFAQLSYSLQHNQTSNYRFKCRGHVLLQE